MTLDELHNENASTVSKNGDICLEQTIETHQHNDQEQGDQMDLANQKQHNKHTADFKPPNVVFPVIPPLRPMKSSLVSHFFLFYFEFIKNYFILNE
ncbi:unnamed protein product [Ceratitis capitata]|uniref:(Mediterranean fruit fly) hypothetical protein n=1 Tax=Ceratitis capitata TaxID=7213 RepID=A0A811UXI9_CERCA|nr:unnamed protein product [Ceratitis capitata]